MSVPGLSNSSEKHLHPVFPPGKARMLDYCAAAVIFWNHHGELLWGNKAAADLFGYAREDLSHQHFADLFPSADTHYIPFLAQENNHSNADLTLSARTRHGLIFCTLQPVPFEEDNMEGTCTTIIPLPARERELLPLNEQPSREVLEHPLPGSWEHLPGQEMYYSPMVGLHTEIARRRKVEETYKNLFYYNPLPMWTFDRDTLAISEVNDAATFHFGYTRAEFAEMTILDFLPSEDRQEVQEMVQQNKEKDRVDYENLRLKKKNGETIYVHLTRYCFPVGNKDYGLVLVQDVTANVLAAEELRRSHEQYFRLFREYPALSWIIDHESLQFLDVNEAVVRHYGYSREEFLQMTLPQVCRPQSEGTILATAGQEYGEEVYCFPSLQHRKKNGDYITVELRGRLLDYNGRKARLVVLKDITEKVQAEQDLHASNRRFHLVSQATSDMIWEWNVAAGTFARSTEGLRRVYGVADGTGIRKMTAWMKRIHPEDRPAVRKALKKVVQAASAGTFEVEYRFCKDDGTYAFVYDRGIAVQDEEGKAVSVTGAAQDITDRKKLEQQLLQKELDKQKQISQASIDIQERERREIGNDLHDNVNQMLTTIKLYLDIALSDEALREELVRKATSTLLRVINEIRHLSRSLMDPSIRDLGLQDALEDYVLGINNNRELQLTMRSEPHIEQLLDEDQKLMVFRVVQEAINNTLKHADATAAHIDIRENKGLITLTIIDDGQGFANQASGRGGGLKNIENRVYLAAGNLAIQSSPGHGCKLSINFPVHIKNNSDL
ncbi:PAS domain S-box protein [Paraflavisolibacter sp. H34]|uniref:PAS domain S-box protein n=1 Tax=Huijunlia imazamoxiresistens TaxID=3127457 RepID=UPI003018175D